MWQKIRSLMGLGQSDLPVPRIPHVHCYFDDNTVLLAAHVKCTDPRSGPCVPTFNFSYPPNAGDLGPAIVKLLAHEVSVVSPEVFELECNKVFCQLHVDGYDQLEARYWYLPMWLDVEGLVVFSPMQKCKRGGYVSFVKGMTVPLSDTTKLGEVATQLILKQDRNLFVEGEDLVDADLSEEEASIGMIPAETDASTEFEVGDRVEDPWGSQGVVTEIDPDAEHGLGIVRVRFDDGRENAFSLIASGITKAR